MIPDQDPIPMPGRIEPAKNDLVPLYSKPSARRGDPEVANTSSADDLVEQFELLDVEEAKEDQPNVNALGDGLSDDSHLEDGLSDGDSQLEDGLSDDSGGYLSSSESDEYRAHSPISKNGDTIIVGELLANHQYFLVYDRPRRSWSVYCWAVWASAPYVSFICRVEGNAHHYCCTFDHSLPNVGPCPYWQSVGVYFFLPGRAIFRFDASERKFFPLPLYPTVDQARSIFEVPPVVDEDGLMGDDPTFGVPANWSAQDGFSDWRDANSQPPGHTQSPTLPQPTLPLQPSWASIEPPSSGVPDVHQGASNPRAFGQATGSRVANPPCINPRQLHLPPSTSASGPQPCPEGPATRHNPLQDTLNVGVPGVQPAVSTPGSSGSPPASSPGPVLLPMASTNDQVMWLEKSGPTVKDVMDYTKEFSRGLKRQGLRVAYCWYCYSGGEEVCEQKDLKPSSLERHLLPHFGLIKFRCQFAECEHGTVTKQQITQHIARNHPLPEGRSINNLFLKITT